MDVIASGDWVHCGREFSAQEVADVCATVAWLPGLARRELVVRTDKTNTYQATPMLNFFHRKITGT